MIARRCAKKVSLKFFLGWKIQNTKFQQELGESCSWVSEISWFELHENKIYLSKNHVMLPNNLCTFHLFFSKNMIIHFLTPIRGTQNFRQILTIILDYGKSLCRKIIAYLAMCSRELLAPLHPTTPSQVCIALSIEVHNVAHCRET